MFVVLKAAFTMVGKEILGEAMKEKGIRVGLIERIEEMYRKTKSRVRVGKKMEEMFWTVRELRQGCPLSLLLFSVLVVNLEQEMSKVRWGGEKIEKERVYTLSYADDIVLIAKGGRGDEEHDEKVEVLLR